MDRLYHNQISNHVPVYGEILSERERERMRDKYQINVTKLFFYLCIITLVSFIRLKHILVGRHIQQSPTNKQTKTMILHYIWTLTS